MCFDLKRTSRKLQGVPHDYENRQQEEAGGTESRGFPWHGNTSVRYDVSQEIKVAITMDRVRSNEDVKQKPERP